MTDIADMGDLKLNEDGGIDLEENLKNYLFQAYGENYADLNPQQLNAIRRAFLDGSSRMAVFHTMWIPQVARDRGREVTLKAIGSVTRQIKDYEADLARRAKEGLS